LQHLQEHDLDFSRQFADLVEEDRAAVGQFEAALSSLDGSGERTLLVAKELRGDERGGNCRAVDADERARGSLRSLVDSAGDELLPRAGLAKQEHAGVSRRHPFSLTEDALQSRALADDVAQGEDLLNLLSEMIPLEFDLLAKPC